MEEYICKYCGRKFTRKSVCVNHELHQCKSNPDIKPQKYVCNFPHATKEGGWKCNSCEEVFRTRAELRKHTLSCKKYQDEHDTHNKRHFIATCPFCKKEWETTTEGFKVHCKFCKENPNRDEYIGHPHTEEFKKKMSNIAKINNFGGWHASKKFNYNGIILDSTYEVTFAKSLDENNIKWERPAPLIWTKDEISHRYYPDFYLPQLNVYVDTKNDYLISHVNPRFGITDAEKIDIVKRQNNVNIIILNKNNLSFDKLKEQL